MFELDESLTHIEASPERVVAVIASLNTPDVMTNLPKPEPTQAYICTIQTGSKLDMFIYLYHQNSHQGRIYPWRGVPIDRSTFPDTENAALEFTESMGFLMDNAHYRKKPPEEQKTFFDSLPCFRKNLEQYAKVQDAKEDPTLIDLTEDLKEVDLEEGGAEETAAAAEPEIELIEEPDGGAEASEVETVEVEAETAPSDGEADINLDDPFGEMTETPAEAAAPASGVASTVEKLNDLKDQAEPENPFADPDVDISGDIDANLDKLVVEKAPPRPAAAQPPPPAAPPMAAAPVREPVPAPAPAVPQAPPPPAAMASLEEELDLAAAVPQAPPPAVAEAELDPKALRERLKNLGRFYASW